MAATTSAKRFEMNSGSTADLHRRGFLTVGSLGLLGISTTGWLALQRAFSAVQNGNASAQSCILFWLEGGPPQMDTWDPKPNSNFTPIATTVAGTQISELFPKVARLADKLSIIRSVSTKEGNHPQGTYFTMTGHRPNSEIRFPSFASIIAKEKGRRNEMPAYVMANKAYEVEPFSYDPAFQAGFIGAGYNPLVIQDPILYGNSAADRPAELPPEAKFRLPDLSLPKSVSREVIEDRLSFLKVVDRQYREHEKLAEFAKMDTFSQQALELVTSPRVKQAFDLSAEPTEQRDAYGRDRIGQSALFARRLVERGCRFVTISPYKTGHWDTHGKNDERMRDTLAPSSDRVISTLITDLENRGMLESTLVLVMGEFGRTPNINAGLGRDHWPNCWSLLLAGGGIQGGRVVGASDEKAANVADRLVSIGDVFATVYKCFGIDWTKTYASPVGRPVYIANGLNDQMGSPITELL